MSRQLYDPTRAKRRPLAAPRPLRRGRTASKPWLWLVLACGGVAAALVGGLALATRPASQSAEVKTAPPSAAPPQTSATKPATPKPGTKVADIAPRGAVERAPMPAASAPSTPAPAPATAVAAASQPLSQAPAARAAASVVAPSPAPPAPARAPPAASPSPAPPSSIGAQAAPEPSAAPSQPLPPTPQAAASRVTASLAEPAAPVAPAREVAPGQPQAKGLVTAGRDAPMECLPEGLKTVLNELAAKFGPVSVISTNRLNTDNHSAGSVRHKLHLACKAVDFKIQADMKAVSEFLRRRPEVAGVNSYRHNSVIHIDLNENAAVARAKARPRQAAE